MTAFVLVSAPWATAATVVRAGYASISNDPDAGTWTISSSGASLTLALDRSRDFEVVRLMSPSGRNWTALSHADTVVKVGSQSIAFGNRAAGFVYQDVRTSVNRFTVQLDATFDLPTARLRATRHYAATSGSPTFETWTTFAPLSASVTLADLNAFRLTVTAGRLRWLSGMQSQSPAAFTQQQRTLAPGERLTLGADVRSSDKTVPWFAIDGESDEFFAGLMWSGAWSLTAVRSTTGIELTLGLTPMSTTIASPIDGPHAFFGVARGGLPAASTALTAFVIEGLRRGRAFEPLVTYNTWFAYGTHIDEPSMLAEMDSAAALGAELFVLDAGWYVGAVQADAADFSHGLGTWQVDSGRFPNGLRALREHAHDIGMKFGLWIEPERVALATVNQSGLAQEPWLAKARNGYGSADTAQVCFSSPAARQWVLAQIVRLLDTVQPDYVKWDNNFAITCDRSGHGHGSTDGNFTHVLGVYQVLSDLRSRYPNLIIENVSGGGNRLDFGMLRYTDVAWMDDRSAPSVHVRHNVEGLSAAFPPAYLLSFVMEHDEEPLHNAADMPLYFRSRMTGALGLCFRTSDFEASDTSQIIREIDIYKDIRRTLRTGVATLLTPQADAVQGPPWDVLQTIPTGNRDVLISAFQWDRGTTEITIKPIGLRSFTTYEVWSVDAGMIARATGAQLMTDGLSILASPVSAAHVLLLKPLRRGE